MSRGIKVIINLQSLRHMHRLEDKPQAVLPQDTLSGIRGK